MNQHIAIIGATSAIAKHCANIWAKQGDVDFTLVGRNQEALERLGKDLAIRNPNGNIKLTSTEFIQPNDVQQVVDDICTERQVDIALIAHGFLPDQRQCESDLALCQTTFDINATSPALFAEGFTKYMVEKNHGTIAILGSVASDRGKKSNYVYGAAKSLIACYAQGLQHRLANTNVKVVLVKPGPTDTPMTAEKKAAGVNLASVTQVAQEIVSGIAKGKPVIYTPKKWWAIMMVVIHLPRFIFNKMDI